MKSVVYKYTFPHLETDVMFDMDLNADVLHADMQGQSVCLWARVDSDAEKVQRRFVLVGTGEPLPTGDTENPTNFRHVATFLQGEGSYVFHVFEDVLVPLAALRKQITDNYATFEPTMLHLTEDVKNV